MVKRVFFILSLLALFSCSMTGIFHESELPSMPDDYENIRIPTDNLLLFADLEGKHLSSRTRSSGDGCETVSLESLLDRDAATQISFESKIVRQIPFIGNKEDKLVMFTKDFHANCDSDSLTVVKIFLIETSDTLEEIYTYGDGPMERAKVINSEEKEMYGRSMHLSLLHSLPTRAGDSDSDGEVLELDASYCIAEKRNPDDIIGSGGRDFPKIDDRNTVGNGGGGGGLPDPGDMPKDPITYDISLSAGTGGCVSGSGTYPSGSLVVCKAESSQNFCFDRWVGDLKGKKECYTFQIEKNVISTAYFDSMLQPVKRPCLNEETGIMNPLAEMKLAPTDKGATNFIGSTFGYTRTGGTKFHSGIDLYAEPGTPLYAMCDGTISRSERYVTEQPVRDKDDNYPPGYSGDDNDAGNRFTLEGIVNGKKIKYSYWHLNEGTPIATNPRTGKPFKRGDKVYQGEVIAYSGKTGNANDVDFPHLHLVVKDEKGNKLNPEDYINGSVSYTESNGRRGIFDTKIINVKCDESEEKIHVFLPDSENKSGKELL